MITEADFKEMSPNVRRSLVQGFYFEASQVRAKAKRESPRNGQTQGSAFLWVSLYGKTSKDRAFRAFVKNAPMLIPRAFLTNARMIDNYRGSKNAWYFGSQTNLGEYDGLKSMVNYLNSQGISALLCDEWD